MISKVLVPILNAPVLECKKNRESERQCDDKGQGKSNIRLLPSYTLLGILHMYFIVQP